MDRDELQRSAVIYGVHPMLDGGRYPLKRIAGERVVVEAHLIAEGHDLVTGYLLWRKKGATGWNRVRFETLFNDEFRGDFVVEEVGAYEFSVQAFLDHFGSWRRDLERRVEAGQDVEVDLLIGAEIVAAAVKRASGDDREALAALERALRSDAPREERIAVALGKGLLEIMDRWPDLTHAVTLDRPQPVWVDRARAGFSAWYEMFPRSTAEEPGRHGTFADAAKRLEYVADLGFDVVYLPPIHPIGETLRKGPNNDPDGAPGAVGSPWAIGAAEGGHTAVHPDLGTLEDFRAFLGRARELGLEVALDIALQCSPDHPWVAEHPEWFERRPDGTIQYAENPPKKYEDIYPLWFGGENSLEIWNALLDLFRFWIDTGVKIFRVDNPHTKPFRFWEWLIDRIHEEHPDVILLAEAFTRPKRMYMLGKLGFTQSYTYFTWRNTAWEFRDYLTELTKTEVAEFFRPNFFTNTPDILPEHLQKDGRPAFALRLILAATLSSNYGIYGPPFELLENVPVAPGSEEYLNSEKYEIRHWDLDREPNLKDLIRRVNRIRREVPALQQTRRIEFQESSNDEILPYVKWSEDGRSVVLVVVNSSFVYPQSAWVELDLDRFGLEAGTSYRVRDLLTGESYEWQGRRNYVELEPDERAAHIFVVERD